MFDIGFMELMLISIVALIVIGPEKLPGAIRTATLWIGRAKRSFQQVKTEIEREIDADDIKRQLHNEAILADLKKVKDKADALVENTKSTIDEVNSEVNTTLKNEEEQLKSAVADKPKSSEDAESKSLETPAKAVADPASIDDPEAESELAPPAADETTTEVEENPEEDGPTEDFYNNPPTGTIKVEGGGINPTTSLDDETDSGRRS